VEKRDIAKLAGGTGVALLGGVAGSGIQYLTGIVLSRMVGAELIGAYFLCLVWTQLASAAARLGFADALLRFVPPARLEGDAEGVRRIVKTTLGLGTAAAAVVTALALLALPLFRRGLGLEPLLGDQLRLFLATVPLHVLFVLLLMVVQAHQRIPPVVAVRDFLQPSVLAVLTVSVVLVVEPGLALVAGYAASLALGILVIARSARRVAPGSWTSPGWMALGPLLTFSLPVVLGDVVHYLYRWADTIVVSWFLELDDVGVYNAALRTSMLIALVFMATNVIYSTMASGYFHTGRRDELRSALHLSMRWCFLLALPIAILFALGAEPILSLWGADFVRGRTALVILAFAQLLTIPNGLLAYTLIMSGRQVTEVFDTVASLALILALDFLLIPQLGLTGAALALLAANIVGLGLRWIQVWGGIGIHPVDAKIAKPLVAAAVAGGLGVAVRPTLEAAFPAAGGSLANLGALAGLGLLVAVIFLAVHAVLGFEEEDRTVVALLRDRLPGRTGR